MQRTNKWILIASGAFTLTTLLGLNCALNNQQQNSSNKMITTIKSTLLSRQYLIKENGITKYEGWNLTHKGFNEYSCTLVGFGFRCSPRLKTNYNYTIP